MKTRQSIIRSTKATVATEKSPRPTPVSNTRSPTRKTHPKRRRVQETFPLPDANSISLDLPLPPSVNAYWRMQIGTSKSGKRYPIMYVTREGKKYHQDIKNLLLPDKERVSVFYENRLKVVIYVSLKKGSPPQDIDNRLKPLLDALEGIVFRNDNQIDELRITRSAQSFSGRIRVDVSPLP